MQSSCQLMCVSLGEQAQIGLNLVTSDDDQVSEVTKPIARLDSSNPLVQTVVLDDEAGELTLGIAQDELDSDLFTEELCVDAGLHS